MNRPTTTTFATTTTMMKRIEKLWLASNQGAQLLVQERHHEAYNIFRNSAEAATEGHALELHKSLPLTAAAAVLTCGDLNKIGVVAASGPAFSTTFSSHAQETTSVVVNQEDLQKTVFGRPFLLYLATPSVAVSNTQDPSLSNTAATALVAGTAVALFNMALTCHLQYLNSREASVRRQLLTHASEIYQGILQLLGRLPLDPDDMLAQVYYVACINVIHLLTEMGDLHQATTCREELVEAFEAVATDYGTYDFVSDVVTALGAAVTIAAATA